MATYAEKMQKQVRGRKSSTSSSKSSSEKMQKQLENYQTRANAAGVSTDKRNWFEKLTNLPENQNAIFDAFELINRPQQAIFRGIESAQEGGSFLEGAKEGITGQETTNFGDILRNAGMDDTALFTGPLSGEDRSIADIVGLAGDVFLDPMDLIPVAGFSKFGKAIKEGDNVLDAAKLLKSSNDVILGGVANVAKKGVGLGDNLIEKGLAKSDRKAFNQGVQSIAENFGLIDKGAKLNDDAIDALSTTLEKAGVKINDIGTDKLGAYQAVKKSLRKTADYSSGVPGNIITDTNRVDNALDMAKGTGTNMNDTFRNKIADYLTKNGVEVTDANIKKVDDMINNLISSKYAPTDNVYNFLDTVLSKGSNTFKGTEDEVNVLKDLLTKIKSDYNISDDILNPIIKTNTDGTISLTVRKAGKGSSRRLADLVKDNSKKSVLEGMTFSKATKMSDNAKAAAKSLQETYDSGVDRMLNELIDEASTMYQDFTKATAKATKGAVDFSPMAREGNVKKALTPEGQVFERAYGNGKGLGMNEVAQGNEATTRGKIFSNNPETANEEAEAFRQSERARKGKLLEKEKNNLYSNKVESVKNQIDGITNKIDEVSEAGAKKVEKIQSKIDLKDETIRNLKANRDNLGNVINNELMKRVDKIHDTKVGKAIVKDYQTYGATLSEMKKIEKQLLSDGLTTKQYQSLVNKYDKLAAKADKLNINITINAAKAMEGAEETFIKNAGKVADDIAKKANNLGTKIEKGETASATLRATKESIKQATKDQVIKLKRVQSNLEAEYSRLINMTEEEIAKQDKFVLDRIGSLQRDIDLLDSMDGKKLFDESFTSGFQYYVNSTVKEAKNLNDYNVVLLHAGLNDDNVMKFIPKGQGAGKIQAGYKRLDQKDANKMIGYLKQNKNFLGEEGQKMLKELEQRVANSSAIVMDNDAYNMLHLVANDSEVHGLLNVFDKINNNYKKFKTFTLGNQEKNIIGNTTNMWLSGVSASDIGKAYTKVGKLADTDYVISLIEKNAKGTLSAAEKSDYKIVQKIMEGGFLGQGKEVQDIGDLFRKAASGGESKGRLKQIWDGLFSTSVKANEFVDNRNRLALLIHAETHPGYLARNGFKDSIDAVNKVLFDPKNLSPFEQKYLKKIFPFYTFTKQNLMFQMSNVLKNNTKYKRLFRTINKAYEAVGEDSYRQYQKENMELPLFKNSDNNLISLKTSLPANDLGDVLSDPVSKLVNMSSPLIKAPFEHATGVDTFTGREIDRTPAETIANMLGVDTLTTSQYDKFNNIMDDINNGAATSDIITDLIPSALRSTDPNKVANSNTYEELQYYQQLFSDLKKQGIDVPTIRELTSSSNVALKNLKKKRNQLKRSQ